jgi:hypothetical protein
VETIDSKRLKFDVACKNSKNASWLGSQYRALVRIEKPEDNGVNAIVFDLAVQDEPLLCCQIELRVSIGQLVSLESDRLRISPDLSPSEIRTHRWCYELGILEGR